MTHDAVVSAVARSLYAHPHQDTQTLIAGAHMPDVHAGEIEEALVALRVRGLARSAGPHWQLTLSGYRAASRIEPTKYTS